MKTLKDYEEEIFYIISNKDRVEFSIKVFRSENVKEKVLEFENFLKKYYKNPKYEMILNIHLKEFRKIFGDFEENIRRFNLK